MLRVDLGQLGRAMLFQQCPHLSGVSGARLVCQDGPHLFQRDTASPTAR